MNIDHLDPLTAPTWAAAHNEGPQPVLLESDESWETGAVLIYSTAVLILLRLAATIRHSPLSPLLQSPRLYYYAIASIITGLASTLTVLFLSIFPATREYGRALMPCASPLLIIGGALTLIPQNVPPQMDAQSLASIMGLSPLLTLAVAAACNAATIAASVLNGAWASTSITIATTLLAVFGPRSPVVARSIGRGIVEPGGPLLMQVARHRDRPNDVIALSITSDGTMVRELSGEGWTMLPTVDDLTHTGLLRLGVRPVVREVVVNEEDVTEAGSMSLLPSVDGRADVVRLISGMTGDVIGHVELSAWMKRPFGEDICKARLVLSPFCSMMAGVAVWASNSKEEDEMFPGALDVYGTMLRNIFSAVPAPDHDTLGFSPNALRIDLSTELFNQLDEYEGKLMKLDRMTEHLGHPHRNIVRVALTAACSKIYQVHDEAALVRILDSLSSVLEGVCAAGSIHTNDDREGNDDVQRDVEELCVIIDGLRNALFGHDSPWLEDTNLYAFVTDRKQRCVHWILDDEKDRLKEYLSAKTHAVILHQLDLNTANMKQMMNGQVQALCVSDETKARPESDPDAEAVFAMYSTCIAHRDTVPNDEGEQVLMLSDTEWNESRRRQPVRVWPTNWGSVVETGSAVATVKGFSEVASLQAVASGISAGTVLFGRLLGG